MKTIIAQALIKREELRGCLITVAYQILDDLRTESGKFSNWVYNNAEAGRPAAAVSATAVFDEIKKNGLVLKLDILVDYNGYFSIYLKKSNNKLFTSEEKEEINKLLADFNLTEMEDGCSICIINSKQKFWLNEYEVKLLPMVRDVLNKLN